MMFMMPMPPTSSEMAAMLPSTMLKICFVRSACRSSSTGTMMRQSSFLWFFASRWRMALARLSTWFTSSTRTTAS